MPVIYQYKYYCETEEAWIYEVRLSTDSAPTKCKNSDEHVITEDSVCICHQYKDLSASVDEARNDAMRVKITKQRTGLTFQPEGFWVTLWKDPTRLTEYDPMEVTSAINKSGGYDSGVTDVVVDSVEDFSESMMLTIGTEDPIQIRSLDASTNTITLKDSTTFAITDDTVVKADRVSVDYDSDDKKTTIKLFITGQESDPLLAGADIQAGEFHSESALAYGVTCKGKIMVPYWTGSSFVTVFGAYMCRGKSLGGKTEMKINAQQSASAVDPDYILQLELTHTGDTPDAVKADVNLDMWRSAT